MKNISFYYRVSALFSLLLLFYTKSLAQHDTAVAVQSFELKNYVQPYVGTFSRSLQFVSKQSNDDKHNLRFSPNSSAFAGISLYYKKLFLYAEVSIPNTHKVRGHTGVKSTALFVHYFENKWGVTGFVSLNKGLLMYMSGNAMYGSRTDMRMFTTGVHYYRIFNSSNFSYLAANSMQRLQMKSKGSFVLMATPSYRQLYSGSSIIPDSLRPFHFTGTEQPSMQLQFFSLQCRPGYIHNFVMKKGKYFFSPAIYFGGGGEVHLLKTGNRQYNGFNFSTSMRIKMVTGINSPKYYFSLEFLNDRAISYLYKTNIKSSYTELSANIGMRF